MPLPWAEGDRIESAILLFESQPLAEAGLDGYLFRAGVGEGRASSYRLMPFTPSELVSFLETRPPGGGFEHVAINPIVSRYFRDAVGYSAALSTEEFIEALVETFDLR